MDGRPRALYNGATMSYTKSKLTAASSFRRKGSYGISSSIVTASNPRRFSGLLVIIRHHPIRLYHIALAFAGPCQQTHIVKDFQLQSFFTLKVDFQLHCRKSTFLNRPIAAGFGNVAEPNFAYSHSGNSAEKFPLQAAWGTGASLSKRVCHTNAMLASAQSLVL